MKHEWYQQLTGKKGINNSDLLAKHVIKNGHLLAK